jgi:hypothetical protein
MPEHAPKGESLLAIMEELSQLLRTARPMPMSASVLVNRAEALDLLDAARAVVPAQIAEADGIVAGARGVVQRAEDRSAAVLAAAEERARALVEKERLVEEAKVRAAEIIAGAQADARALMDQANDYCDRQLAQLEIELGQVAKQVKAGRTVIQARLTTEDGA